MLSIRLLNKILFLFIFLGILLLPVSAFAATRTWDNGGGDNLWSNATNWSSNDTPDSTDTVQFDDTGGTTDDCIIDDVGTFSGGTMSINAGYTGTVTQNVAITTAAYSHAGTGTWVNAAAMQVTTFTKSTGTFTNNDTLSVSSTFNHSGGTFNGAGTTVLNSTTADRNVTTTNMSFNNLTIDDGGGGYVFTIQNALDVNNNLTITSGTLDTGSNFGVTVGGNYANGGTFTANSATVTFDATDTGNTINPGASSFYGLTFNGAGGVWSLDTNAATVTNALTITAGTFDLNGLNLDATGATFSNTNNGTLRLQGSETITSLTMDTDTGTVVYNGGGSYAELVAGDAYYNLTFNGAGDWTLDAALDVNNNFTITDGTVATGGFNINVGNSWSNADTFTHGSAVVVFDATDTGNTINPGASSFYGMTFDGVGGAWSLSTNNLTVENALTITNGIFDLNGRNITATGVTFSNDTNGTLRLQGGETVTDLTMDTDTGTVTYNGSGTYTELKAGDAYNNLTFNGTGSWTLDAALDANGNFTITDGAVASGGFDINVAGAWSNADTFTHGSATVTLDHAAADTVDVLSGGSSFYNLTLNDSSAGATFELEDALDVNNNLTITAGTLDTKSGENNSIAVGNNFSNAGTFTARDGTVTFDATDSGNTFNPGGSSFYGITFNGSGGVWSLDTNALTVTNALTITAGTFDLNAINLDATGATFSNTNNGTLRLQGGETVVLASDSDTGTVVYYGTGGPYAELAAGDAYKNLTFNGSGGVWTLDANLDVNGALTITDGTLDLGGFNLDNTTGTFSNSNNGTLRLQGGETITALTMDTDSGTVVYNGTGAYTDLEAGDAYYNLTFNGSGGSWTMDAALDVNGDLTITDGTLATGGNNITLAGSWSKAGTFTHGNGTVTLDGAGGTTQTIVGDTTFYNLTATATTARTIAFTDGSTQTIPSGGSLTLTGSSGQLLTLVSTTDTANWNLNFNGATQTVQYADIDWSNSGAVQMRACASTDGGNNTNWSISGGGLRGGC